MQITVIHGQGHKGSTYNITRMLTEKLSTDVITINEFFMPSDTPEYCVGCFRCIYDGEKHCPHKDKVQAIVSAIEQSDIIVVDSPTYCMEMTGQLKTLFDHFAYMWLPHRPNKTMFKKIGITISTAAGSGAKKVAKSIANQLSWLGIAKTYTLSKNVNASSWDKVSDKIKQQIESSVDSCAIKVKHSLENPTPSLKTKLLFKVMGGMQKKNTWNNTDKNHWIDNGWLDKAVPWRN